MLPSSFEPILLDLSEPDDIYVLTAALGEFAARLEEQADEGGAAEAHTSSLRVLAARSRRMMLSIDDQMEANAAARHAVSGS